MTCNACGESYEDNQNRIFELTEIVEAVAHIGIDFGYGKYELPPEIIDKARELLSEGDL